MLNKAKKYVSTAIIFSLFQQMLIPVKVCTTTREIEQATNEANNQLKRMQKKSQIQSQNKAEIEKQIRELTSKMGEVTKKIENLNNDSYKNQDEIFKTLENIDNINNQVNKLNVNIENMQKELGVMEDAFLCYLKHIYTQKNNQMAVIDFVFNAANYNELIRNMKYTGAYAEHIQNIQENYRKKTNEMRIIQDIKNEEIKKHQKAIKVNQENINKNTTNATEMEGLYSQYNINLQALKELLGRCEFESEVTKKAQKDLQENTKKMSEKFKESPIAEIKEQAKPENKKDAKEKEKIEKEKNKPNEQEKPQPIVISKGGFVYPVSGQSSVSQGFHRGHPAYDIQTNGRPNAVVSICDGIVVAAGRNAGGRGYGNCVIIKGDNGAYYLYAHLSVILVRVGQRVRAGQQIGNVGNTGNVSGRTGMHLHIEKRIGGINGKRVQPELIGVKIQNNRNNNSKDKTKKNDIKNNQNQQTSDKQNKQNQQTLSKQNNQKNKIKKPN